MSLLTKVGSFSVAGATNQSITGVGFQPKALIFWANQETADGGHASDGDVFAVECLLGMTDGTTVATVCDSDDFTDGDTFFQAGSVGGSVYCVLIKDKTSVDLAGKFVSFDSDGFTLNFADAAAAAYVVNYMALGGTDLQAKIISNTAADVTGNKSWTGAGFQPDALILAGGVPQDAFDVAANAGGAIGLATGTSARGSVSSNYASAGANPAKVGYSFTDGAVVYQRTDKAYVETYGEGSGDMRYEADLASMDSDGFTLNFSKVVASGSGQVGSNIYALCLKGANFKVGSFTQKTSTGSDPHTGIGFQPQALLCFGGMHVASTTKTVGPIAWQVAGTDGTNVGTIASASGSHIANVLDRANFLFFIDDGSTTFSTATKAKATFTSFDTDGFTLNYTQADGSAREVLFLAIGPAGGAASPPALGIDQHPHAVFGPF